MQPLPFTRKLHRPLYLRLHLFRKSSCCYYSLPSPSLMLSRLVYLIPYLFCCLYTRRETFTHLLDHNYPEILSSIFQDFRGFVDLLYHTLDSSNLLLCKMRILKIKISPGQLYPKFIVLQFNRRSKHPAC